MGGDMDTEAARGMIRAVAKCGRGEKPPAILVFSGGEPLLRKDLFELAEFARGEGLVIALASNGTLIDEREAERIAAAGFSRVAISLDAAESETHDRLRNREGAFQQAIAALEALAKVNVARQINCTITRETVDQLDDLFELARRLQVQALHLFLLVPVGCGQEMGRNDMLDAGEVEAALNRFYELSQSADFETRATCAPHYQRILRQKGHDQPDRGGCLAGRSVCFISHRGEVFGCGYLPISAGNVLKEDFGRIWQESALFSELRDPNRLEGKCGRCEYKIICGGCRARAWQVAGNLYGPEPACAYVPGS